MACKANSTMDIHQMLKLLSCTLLLSILIHGKATANEFDDAKWIHDRIAGVPPDPVTLNQMALLIDAGDLDAAARLALEHPAFFDVTLKSFAAPSTNRDQSPFVPLNDYTATVIGLIRDGADFRRMLYDNILYIGGSGLGLPAYAVDNNDHYEALEAANTSLKTALVPVTQSTVNGLPASATAGVMTSRAGARAFFIDGTNRAMLRFTLLNHLCRDLEQVKDFTLSPDRIRQDVTRSPGGDSRLFLNNCIGCHSGMDPLAQAFAYYDFDNSDVEDDSGVLRYNSAGSVDSETGTRVNAKYHINSGNFPAGYVTPDDGWENYWRTGPNQSLQWDSALPGSGTGASSMGRELAHSGAFAQCQVTKVFRTVCLREPHPDDQPQIDFMINNLDASNFDLKESFVDAATYCVAN